MEASIDKDQYTIDFILKDDLTFIYDINLKVSSEFFIFAFDIDQNKIQ